MIPEWMLLLEMTPAEREAYLQRKEQQAALNRTRRPSDHRPKSRSQ